MESSRLEDWLAQRLTIGVTGFARSGKTVFITSFAHALISFAAFQNQPGQGPLTGFSLAQQKRLRSVRVRDDLSPTYPHFPFRAMRDALLGRIPAWPTPTEGISRLILEIEYEPDHVNQSGFWLPFSRASHACRTKIIGRPHLQLELVDYPGEWLMDLALLDKEYDAWSEDMWQLAISGRRARMSEGFRSLVASLPSDTNADEDIIIALTAEWKNYLKAALDEGLPFNQPGRLLRPGPEGKHAPVLRFAPIPNQFGLPRLRKVLRKRFKLYQDELVRPFFKMHFAKMDRQVVLVDIVRVLSQRYGDKHLTLQEREETFKEFSEALRLSLSAFRYGQGTLLSGLQGNRTNKALFVATKADHVVRGDRVHLERLLGNILHLIGEHQRISQETSDAAIMALASVRATQDMREQNSPYRELLSGRRAGEPEPLLRDPGAIPLDFPINWEELAFEYAAFEPLPMLSALQEGFPAINLGKAIEFLIGNDCK